MCPECERRQDVVEQTFRLMDRDRQDATIARIRLEKTIAGLEAQVAGLKRSIDGTPSIWLSAIEAASILGWSQSMLRHEWRKHHRDQIRTVIRAHTRYWHREDIEAWAATG